MANLKLAFNFLWLCLTFQGFSFSKQPQNVLRRERESAKIDFWGPETAREKFLPFLKSSFHPFETQENKLCLGDLLRILLGLRCFSATKSRGKRQKVLQT